MKSRITLKRAFHIAWWVFMVPVGIILVMWAWNHTVPSELAALPLDELEEVVLDYKGSRTLVPAEHWPVLFSYVRELKKAAHIGWMGERWVYFEKLELNWGRSGKYELSFATRQSLGGHVLAGIRKESSIGYWHFSYYRADELHKWLLDFQRHAERYNTPLQRTIGAGIIDK